MNEKTSKQAHGTDDVTEESEISVEELKAIFGGQDGEGGGGGGGGGGQTGAAGT